MTTAQKIIKYIAIAIAACLIVGIVSGIIQVVGLISNVLSRNDEQTDEGNYINLIEMENVSVLDIELGYAQLTIKTGDKFKVETNDKSITAKLENNKSKLTLEEPQKLIHSTDGATVIIYVPEEAVFDLVEIESGAGTIIVESLSVKKISLDLGAGKAEFDELFVTKAADIDCGTGLTVIKGGTINNLDIEIGVGKTEITSNLTGNCYIENGIGTANIKILNSQENYTVNTSSGIGTVSVNGQNISKDSTIGNGENLIKISGGIGNVSLSFETELPEK